jgi:Zn-dependent protease
MELSYSIGVAFFVLYWAVFVYSIVLHEVAHGYSSYLLGDPTAYREGRLTLNPLKHVDVFFSILMPLVFFISMGVPFGGAKPCPVNPYLYRSLRWGSLTSAAAGPLTNVALALIFAGLFLFYKATARQGANVTPSQQFLAMCMVMNLFLAIFNLLPIPPLDGSHVLASLLPRSAQDAWGKVQALGWMPILAVVILSQFAVGWIPSPPGIVPTGPVGSVISWPAYIVLRHLGVDQNKWAGFLSPWNLLSGGS